MTIFESLGKPANHRTQPYQLVKPMAEVTVPKYKEEFPYLVSPIMDGVNVAIVISGEVASVFSDKGKPMQNVEAILESMKSAKKEGVYFAYLAVPPSVYTATKLKACISPFRTRELNGKEREAVEVHMQAFIYDFVTVEEFIELEGKRVTGYSPLSQQDRIERFEKSLKKVFKSSKNIVNLDCRLVHDDAELCESHSIYADTGYTGLLVRSPDHPWDAGHKNYYWMSIAAQTQASEDGLEVLAGDKNPEVDITEETAVKAVKGEKGKKVKKGKKGKKAKKGRQDDATEELSAVEDHQEVDTCVAFGAAKGVMLVGFTNKLIGKVVYAKPMPELSISESGKALTKELIKAEKKGDKLKKKKSPVGKAFNISYQTKGGEYVDGSLHYGYKA